MKWVYSSLLGYNKFCTKTDIDDKIKYHRLIKEKKHELDEKHVYKFFYKELKTAVNNLKNNYGKSHGDL